MILDIDRDKMEFCRYFIQLINNKIADNILLYRPFFHIIFHDIVISWKNLMLFYFFII